MRVFHFLYIILYLSFLIACSPKANVVEPSIDEPVAFSDVLNERQDIFRKSIFESLEKFEDEATDLNMKNYYLQVLTMAGREDMSFTDGLKRQKQKTCDVTDARTVNSDEADFSSLFSNIIGDHNVVIINEDHSFPRDRTVILNLVNFLNAQGFTHYAAETFGYEYPNGLEGDSVSEKTGNYALVNDGHYSNEPLFGRLITKVKSSNFELVTYEIGHGDMLPQTASVSERIRNRENIQSDNLIKNVLGSAPQTKIIIHVGHSHVAEKPIPNYSNNGSTKWMAALLKEKTGIDPLTISQTACTSPNDKIVLSNSMTDKEGKAASMLTDLVIGHPEHKFKDNRPLWRYEMGDKAIPIPEIFLVHKQPIVIEARFANQEGGAVPVERLLLRPGETNIPLLLPNGNYRLEAFNIEGRIKEPVIITVNE